MTTLTRNEKRRQIVAFLRDPLNAPNTNAAIARFFGVSSEWVAKLREEVEAAGPAFYKGTHHELPLSALRLDGGTQPRAKLDMAVAREYRDDLKDGAVFPPIGVTYDGTNYWVWDGFHRVKAYEMADRKSIPAEVRMGTRRDAILLAAGANVGHGMRRTNEDKRRSVEYLLRDPDWAKRSDRWIASACHVSHVLAAEMRKELHALTGNSSSQRMGIDGKERPPAFRPPAGTGGRERPTEDELEPFEPEPPMAAPVVVDHRISVTLNGDPEADCRRLLASYPRGKLAGLANAILDELDADEDGPAHHAEPVKLGQVHRMILDALADASLSSRQLMTVALNYRVRICELRRAGYTIESFHVGKDYYYKLVRKPE